ncbi:hypothetical protein GINT2_002337 [Glugoides intestinalis]
MCPSEKDLSTLNFTNELDVLYAYRNVSIDKNLLNEFHRIPVVCVDFGLVCFDVVETALLEEIGEPFVDKEMQELIKEIFSEDFLKSINKRDSALFFSKNLNTLLRPLVNVCNKRIVDLVYYVYKKTGISHFNFLFDSFTVIDQQIELHLLAAKGIKERSFDFSNFKDCLDEKTSSDEKLTAVDCRTFALAELPDPIIPLPFLETSENPEETPIHLESPEKPIKHQPEDQSYHLCRAKTLLLSAFNYINPCFAIDNFSAFLCMKFDREIFECFISNSSHPLFPIYLNRLQNAPFFFYQEAGIRKVLAAIPKQLSDPYLFNDRPVQPFILRINCYLLKHYLKFASETFSSIEFPITDYLLIAKGLRFFVEHYRSPALFKIFKDLLCCKIPDVLAEIKRILLKDLELYLSVFYVTSELEPALSSDETDDQDEDSLFAPFPTLLDPVDSLVSAYLNPCFYVESDRTISTKLLVDYKKKNPITLPELHDFLNTLLIDISLDANTKIYVLRSINKVHELICGIEDCVNCENKIVSKLLQNLKLFPKMEWRYRMAFLKSLETLANLGVEKDWVKETLKKDRVFYIKKMIKDL